MLACGLSLNLTSEGVMLLLVLNIGYPLNPIPVGRPKLGLQLNIVGSECRFRKKVPTNVPTKMTVPILY